MLAPVVNNKAHLAMAAKVLEVRLSDSCCSRGLSAVVV